MAAASNAPTPAMKRRALSPSPTTTACFTEVSDASVDDEQYSCGDGGSNLGSFSDVYDAEDCYSHCTRTYSGVTFFTIDWETAGTCVCLDSCSLTASLQA